MIHHAWHYVIAPPEDVPWVEEVIAGTHCGEGLETEKQAIADIARAHGVTPEPVRVRKAGVENF